MKLVFIAPFKPVDHSNASGDRTIARAVLGCLKGISREVEIPSRVRTRWIFWSPRIWPALVRDFIRCLIRYFRNRPDAWVTYHCYYKAPDILGPLVCGLLNIPYLIVSASYSARRKRRFRTLPGYALNRFALSRADRIIATNRDDYENLQRAVPPARLRYIRPGLDLDRFSPAVFPEPDRGGEHPVILTAAMFREDVKTLGLIWLIRCCGDLAARGVEFRLKIAGDGPLSPEIRACARKHLPGRHCFVGRVSGREMPEFYRSGHVFAFPGIREALGMVFMEAQACGLPVVAFEAGELPDIVVNGRTGFLVPPFDAPAFARALEKILEDPDLTGRMGRCARENACRHHDIRSTRQSLARILSASVSAGVT